MILEKLKIKNFKGIELIELRLNKTVNRFVGLNGSGKTSILEAIWICLKGIGKKDTGGNFIGNRSEYIGISGKSSDIETIFINNEGVNIKCSNHITQQGNELHFESQDQTISPDTVKNLFDAHFLNATEFCKLTPQQQSIKLGINVDKFKENLESLKYDAKVIRKQIKDIGVLDDIEKVEHVNINLLNDEKEKIRKNLNLIYLQNKKSNDRKRAEYNKMKDELRLKNEKIITENEKRNTNINISNDCLKKLREIGYTGKEVSKFINELPKPNKLKEIQEPEYVTERPDDSDLQNIEKKIYQALINNEKYVKYQKYQDKKNLLNSLEQELQLNVAEQKKVAEQKIRYIKDFNFAFSGVSVNDDGELTINGRSLITYSKAEREKIVGKFSAYQNPELKIRMIDEFNTLDEKNQDEVIKYFLDKGYQLLITEVGTEKLDESTILMKSCKVVDTYEEKDHKENII